MKNQDLNKLRIYKLLTIILTSLLIISTVLAILTSGFSAWDRFFPKNKTFPIVHIDIDPLVMNIDSQSHQEKYICTYNIETAGGIYKILNDFRMDSIHVEIPNLFYEKPNKESLKFTDVVIDKFILDSQSPDLIGLLKFKSNVIIAAQGVIALESKSEKEIGFFNVYFPYEFENQKYIQKIRVPIIIKKDW
jgi:hypothetical protein